MNKSTYDKYFKEYNRIGYEWKLLLREVVGQLGTVRFDEPFQIPVHSSNGDIYGVHVSSITIDDDGWVRITDTDGDVWFKDSLDDSACLSVICEIFEQTDCKLPD